MLFQAIPNSQTAQETSAGRTPGVLHAALWPVLRPKPEPERNLDLNLRVRKMGPSEGVAGGTEVASWVPCAHQRLQPSMGWVETTPSSLPLNLDPFVPGGPRPPSPPSRSAAPARHSGKVVLRPTYGFSGTTVVEWSDWARQQDSPA